MILGQIYLGLVPRLAEPVKFSIKIASLLDSVAHVTLHEIELLGHSKLSLAAIPILNLIGWVNLRTNPQYIFQVGQFPPAVLSTIGHFGRYKSYLF